MLEPDGVAFSHGNLFFFVPSGAFASDADRLQFVRELHARLGDEAKARSAPYIPKAISAG
jgi:hypothetical protein